ncbi:DUF397 domain-containing protein [Streptomyces sp. JJ66]|uniref:DUF397 domain-containing protein n=1 Tax=Streptomyces sp. JJ66 TaxID=2803843 RepID=UPI001C5866DA|nr:DUF397 domain-containing protein [Streptomyces sp. JJ66]MBW1603072.1 DUF397 domain-containing protein [Streptomyces sp. JJ66]
MNNPRPLAAAFCVPDDAWRKSSYSGSGTNCVEVAAVPGGLAVRDSKNSAIPGFQAGRSAWVAFIQAINTSRM